VADRTDRGRRTLEKLLFMAADTVFVPRIIGDVGKGIRLAAHLLPVGRWEFMARVAFEPMGLGTVRKLRITGGACNPDCSAAGACRFGNGAGRRGHRRCRHLKQSRARDRGDRNDDGQP